MSRQRSIGTAAETAVVRYLNAHGFRHAERRALRGAYDLGDITGTPGLVWQVKSGAAAEQASDDRIARWLEGVEKSRVLEGADYGILVTKRLGVGLANAGNWWVHPSLDDLLSLTSSGPPLYRKLDLRVRVRLADIAELLRLTGKYGG